MFVTRKTLSDLHLQKEEIRKCLIYTLAHLIRHYFNLKFVTLPVRARVSAINRSHIQYLKADFHSAENIARSNFSAHFLLNCSNQIQISEHISKESEREKSIARHFPLNGNPP